MITSFLIPSFSTVQSVSATTLGKQNLSHYPNAIKSLFGLAIQKIKAAAYTLSYQYFVFNADLQQYQPDSRDYAQDNETLKPIDEAKLEKLLQQLDSTNMYLFKTTFFLLLPYYFQFLAMTN